MARGVLNWSTIQIPFFAAGLNTKQDPRFSSPPSLDVARDVQFELLGGLQARPPFAAMANAIQGGGTLSNCRRMATVNGELCVFTDTAFYSWNAQLAQWVLRGTHLAVSVDETPRFATTGDQIDGDRAELNGTIVYAWAEGAQVFAAALDKVTGSVLVSPTAVSTAIGRPRLVALATKILFFVEASATLLTVRAIDPAAPSAAISGAGTTVLATNYNLHYDVVRAGTQDLVVGACRRQTTTSYEVFTVTPGLVVTNSTKARTCDGPIAVSAIPDGTKTQIVRANSTNIQGDLLTTSTLADVFTAQAIGTVALGAVQIAAAHRSVQNGGAFRCYVFWTSPIIIFNTPTTKSNWVDTANTLGTQATFAPWLTAASRAFDYNGSVYVWLAFGENTVFSGSGSPTFPSISAQNTYFLYRDDGYLANAKCVATHGAGAPASNGRLPGVAVTGASAYAWCAAARRRFVAGGVGHVDFAARMPVDVTFAFDSNDARRSSQLGATLYISGGEVLQYDGTRLVEVGFHVYPWTLPATNSAGGSVASGAYAYKMTWRYENGTGETERSTTATTATVTITTGTGLISSSGTLVPTHKLAVSPESEIWRTAVAPGVGAPFYKVSSNDPAALTNPNRYLPNDPTSSFLADFDDNLADSSATGNETNPENETVLENLAPPGAQIIIATDTRLFLAGVAGDPHRVRPSKLRNDGEVVAFHDSLPIDVPHAGGDITAIWFQDEVLYVGRQYAVYALPGVGFDNTGGGQNFGPARIVSADVGPVSQEAQALTPIGTLFKSAKGWQLLDRGGQVRYVGGPASAFDGDTVLAMHVTASRHQVRILTNSRLLLWDYRGAIDATTQEGAGNWAEWTVADGVHATVWNGTYIYLTATGPKMEQASYSGLTYGIDAETSWIKPADLQGFAKLGYIEILGEYRSACLVRVRVARDYQYDGAGNVAYDDDKAWNPSPAVVGSALQVRHSPSRGQGEAFKVRVTAVTDAVRATLATTALSPQVTTSGTAWAATWQAGASYPGLMGNALTMSLAFEDSAGAAFSIDVRDHFAWNHAVQRWIEDLGNVGVRVLCRAGSSPTVAQLEAAIAAGTALVTLSAADATPGKVVSAAGMANLTATGTLGGGAYGSPTGEAIRLTGIGLECGIEPGLNRRLPAAQKQ